ncbi:PASTA domain-containing protein [Streptococcus suis]|uniref:Stk1 family PASTA domain-containing Ser/Thr kinase n=1 Tax=Streptococcus suis TaxID=1307 RepID=UPI00241294AA|nr:PASTA domain-containing protein [Streptococcus suis]MDG4506117.1 PASTA domain-containing protein [Streptococcus suis]HEM2826637.1 PASTA domain-containing protein [Streptococcus suis]HEM4402737.1 PASTA domain-containing protein [Streptococcus suis]
MQPSNRKYKGRIRNWKKPVPREQQEPEAIVEAAPQQVEHPTSQLDGTSVIDADFGNYAPTQIYAVPSELDQDPQPIQYSRKEWRKSESFHNEETVLTTEVENEEPSDLELQDMLQELAREVERVDKAQGRKLLILVSVFAVLTLLPLVFLQFTRRSIESELASGSNAVSSTSTTSSSKTATSSSQTAQMKVPDVTNMSLDAARLKLEQAGFVVGTISQEKTDTKADGTVIRTNPQAGSKKAKGETVHIVVANKSTQTLLNLVGKTSDEAAEILRSMGATVEIKLENSQQVPSGSVIKSEPSSGATIEKGSKVTLYVSNGSPQKAVPNVVGQSEDTAVQLLQDEGFAVGTSNREYHSSIEAGKVISLNPPAGTKLEAGAVVDITISKGKELVMPDLSSGQLTYAQAYKQLQALGVNVNLIEKVEDRSYVSTTSDLVVGQYPSAGSTIEGTITLYVSVASTTTTSSSTLSSSTQSSSMHSEEGR